MVVDYVNDSRKGVINLAIPPNGFDQIIKNEITARNVVTRDSGAEREKLAEMIIEELDKPKPHLANYMYEEDGELKTGTTTVMR